MTDAKPRKFKVSELRLEGVDEHEPVDAARIADQFRALGLDTTATSKALLEAAGVSPQLARLADQAGDASERLRGVLDVSELTGMKSFHAFDSISEQIEQMERLLATDRNNLAEGFERMAGLDRLSEQVKQMEDMLTPRLPEIRQIETDYITPAFNSTVFEGMREERRAIEEAREAQLRAAQLLGQLVEVMKAQEEISDRRHRENLAKQDELHELAKQHASRLTVTQILVVAGFSAVTILIGVVTLFAK